MYVHLVFAVGHREAVLSKSIRPRIFEYMSGIVSGQKHKSIIINGVADHVHILLGLNPTISVSDTVHDLKRSSSLFINENRLMPGRFCWQEGYGGFTYSHSQLDNVYKYIERQEAHHAKNSFRVEYLNMLEMHEVEYNPDFIFAFFDDIH